MPQIIHRFDPELKVYFEVMFFPEYTVPHGWLANHPACHALMMYALHARKAYEDATDTTAMEGTHDENPNYHNLFKSIACQCGVVPEEMLKFWRNVDMQFVAMQLPLAPQHVRFDNVQEVKTGG